MIWNNNLIHQCCDSIESSRPEVKSEDLSVLLDDSHMFHFDRSSFQRSAHQFVQDFMTFYDGRKCSLVALVFSFRFRHTNYEDWTSRSSSRKRYGVFLDYRLCVLLKGKVGYVGSGELRQARVMVGIQRGRTSNEAALHSTSQG